MNEECWRGHQRSHPRLSLARLLPWLEQGVIGVVEEQGGIDRRQLVDSQGSFLQEMVQLLLVRYLLLSLPFASGGGRMKILFRVGRIVVGGAKMVYDLDAVGETRAHIDARRTEHEATQ